MQTDQTQIDLLQDLEGQPPLYSKTAVRLFSFFFSSIFGGVLLMQNLKDLKKPNEARTAIFAAIGITLAAIVLPSLLPASGNSLSIPINLAGAYILSDVIYKKYIPDGENYPTKSIRKPLIIGLAIFVPLTILAIYGTYLSLNHLGE